MKVSIYKEYPVLFCNDPSRAIGRLVIDKKYKDFVKNIVVIEMKGSKVLGFSISTK